MARLERAISDVLIEVVLGPLVIGPLKPGLYSVVPELNHAMDPLFHLHPSATAKSYHRRFAAVKTGCPRRRLLSHVLCDARKKLVGIFCLHFHAHTDSEFWFCLLFRK